MGAKLLKENAAATQASRIMQNEEHRGKQVMKYVRSAKLPLKVASFLFPLYFEREMASWFIQALSGT